MTTTKLGRELTVGDTLLDINDSNAATIESFEASHPFLGAVRGRSARTTRGPLTLIDSDPYRVA